MDFDYEIVAPKNGTFGKKRNGKWDGVIGDLARGVFIKNIFGEIYTNFQSVI